MRLFFAIRPSPALLEALLDGQAALRRAGAGGRFPPPEALHLTLAFLGETEALGGATAALAACGGGPFPLALSGLGRFGELWWAGTAPQPRLTALAERLGRALARQGFDLEERTFVPHFTLARRLALPQAPLWTPPERAMTVDRVWLMRSELGPGGAVYTPLAWQAL